MGQGSNHMLVKTALHKRATGKNRVTWRWTLTNTVIT